MLGMCNDTNKVIKLLFTLQMSGQCTSVVLHFNLMSVCHCQFALVN